MESISLNYQNTVQCWASSEELRHHTEPNIYPETGSRRHQSLSEGCSPRDTWTSSSSGSSDDTGERQDLAGSIKRKFTETDNGPRKRGRWSPTTSKEKSSTSPFSCESIGACSSSLTTNTTSDSEGRKRKRDEEDQPTKRSRKGDYLSEPATTSSSCESAGASSSPLTTSTSSASEGRKRKREEEEESRKRSRKGDHLSEPATTSSSCESAGASSSPLTTSTSSASEGRKRKREEEEESRKRSRKGDHLSEGPKPTCTSTESPGTSSTENTSETNSRESFEAKYKTGELLGEGGFGSVYAGYRTEDNMPVAIKCISQRLVFHITMRRDSENLKVPLEVALLLILEPAAGETSAAVRLLDWYSLDDELILVQERPVPCCNLSDYIRSKGSILPEHEAKVIAKQLLDGLIELQSKGVYHRDTMPDNILIQTGSEVSRVHIIDFGIGAFLLDKEFHTKQGIIQSTSMEWYTETRESGEPAAVEQFCLMMCSLFGAVVPDDNNTDIIDYNPHLKEGLSTDGQSFLQSCLGEIEPTLETLRQHPWIKLSSSDLSAP